MDVWTIIPVKSLLESKGRLAHLLPPESRARLVRRLLTHVLATVTETPGISRTLVISNDLEVLQIAGAHGALAVEEERPYGLNSAVAHAYHLAAEGGADAVLILPADLPFLGKSDIELMIASGLEDGRAYRSNVVTVKEFAPSPARTDNLAQPVMAISSDRLGSGTNALLLRPLYDFDFHYGPDSLQQHLREALDRDFLVRLVSAPGLQFDLDTEEDWQIFQEDDRNDLLKQSQIYPLTH